MAFVLFGLFLYALFAPAIPASSVNNDSPILLEESLVALSIDDDAAALEASDTQSAPASLSGAFEIVVDGTPVLALKDRAEAEALLWDNLNAQAIAGVGEIVQNATYDCTIYVTEATGNVQVLDRATALALLSTTPSLIPVKVTAVRTEYAIGTTDSSAQNDASIPKGMRVITQLGQGVYTATGTTLTYRAGELVQTAEPVTETITGARQSIVRTGAYTSKSDKPGKTDGPTGKNKGALSFVYPMRGKVSKYFGFYDGVMHNGLDVNAQTGTQIVAPCDGIVVFVGERGTMGTVVDIDHGNGFVSRLTHLSELSIVLNQRVYQNDPIGKLTACDNEALATHLHYEILVDGIPTNPLFYID